jgi:protein phosphatase
MMDRPRDFLVGHQSHPGPRKTNQDTVLSVGLPDGRWLVAVADGMGGLTEGEKASKTALSTLFRSLSEGADLPGAVEDANLAVLREAPDKSIGTTVVAALLSGTRAEIVSVGDSRAYHMDPLGLVQVTRDHTMKEEAERTGAVPRGQMDSTPWAKALARFVGNQESVVADRFGPLELQEGGWILLCSDGLHEVLSQGELEAILTEETAPDQAAVRLVETALERNTQDNVTAALVHRPSTRAPGRRRDDDTRAWSPEVMVARSHRSGFEKRRILLAVVVSLMVIPLLIVLYFALRWVLSPGTG